MRPPPPMRHLPLLFLTLGGAGVAATLLAAPPVPTPTDNPQTPEKVALGRQLFFDPILSRDRTVSCASCHDPKRAFSTPDPITPGVAGRLGTRNAISLLNVAYRKALTWNGASPHLETQAMIPLLDHNELDLTEADLRDRLNSDATYAAAFQQVFGSPPTVQNTVRALAAFQRTLVSYASAYDRYQAGDASAFTPAQVRGQDLFFGKAECFHCHTGRDFTDGRPHNDALQLFNADAGVAVLTSKDADVGKFITPSLRNVALTSPYLHDGSVKTLRAVVEAYNRGGEPNPNADPLIRPLGLSDREVSDLVAFLQGLSDFTAAKNPAFQAPVEVHR